MVNSRSIEMGTAPEASQENPLSQEKRMILDELRGYLPQAEKLSLLKRIRIKKDAHHFGRLLAHACLQRIFGNPEYEQMLAEAQQAGLPMKLVKQGYYERLDETDEGDFDAQL